MKLVKEYDLVREYLKEIVYVYMIENYVEDLNWVELAGYFSSRKYSNLLKHCIEDVEMTFSEFEMLANKVLSDCKLRKLEQLEIERQKELDGCSTR